MDTSALQRHPHPDLLPEEQLLLAIGKSDPSADDRARARELLRRADLPWDKAFMLAVAHRVDPMLAYNLERSPALHSLVPLEVRQTLRASRGAAAIRRTLYTRALAPIIEALAGDNIPVALMKGAALVETVYPPGTRGLHDFDILVHRGDYARVAAAFTACGFSKALRAGQTEASELESYHQVALLKQVGDAQLTIDLHWRMYPPDRAFCQIATSALLARAKPIPFGATTAAVLCPEDMLVHYASQLVNDSLVVSYQRVGDIYAIVRSAPDWESVVETATRAGAAGATHLALAYASLLGAAVPSWVSRELRSACTGCHVASAYLALPSRMFRSGSVPPAARSLLVTLLYSRFTDRIRYLLLFSAGRWQASLRDRGVVRSGWKALRGIGQALRSLAAIATRTLWHHSAWRERRSTPDPGRPGSMKPSV